MAGYVYGENKKPRRPEDRRDLILRNAGCLPLCSRRLGGLVIKKFLTLDKAIALTNSSPPTVPGFEMQLRQRCNPPSTGCRAFAGLS
jgi:hypothetical protein